MAKARVRETLKLSEDYRGANDNLIGVLSAREILTVKCAAKTAHGVSSCIADGGGPSAELSAVDLDEKTDVNFSPKATLSRDCAKTTDENAFKNSLLIMSLLNETYNSTER